MKRFHKVSIGLLCGLLAALVTGCARNSASGPVTAKASASLSAMPFPLKVRVEGVQSTILDASTGSTIAEIQAERAAVSPGKDSAPSDPIGLVQDGSAILYQGNKQSARLKADQMRADRDKRTVIGTGNVTVTSLLQPDSPTIRADTMTWRYNTNTIVGEGNVLITRKPDLQIPGKRFVADTAIRRYTLYTSETPATGSF